MTLADIPAEVRAEYLCMRALPDGRIIGVHRLMFHWTLHVDIDPVGYGDKYCIATLPLALEAFESWTGEGDPTGWHRHLKTARRRELAPDGTVIREWIAG